MNTRGVFTFFLLFTCPFLFMTRSQITAFRAVAGLGLSLALGGCATGAKVEANSRPGPRPSAPPHPTGHAQLASSFAGAPAYVDEPTNSLSLAQALALTLAHNPELASFSWNVRVGEARRLQAGLYPNPEAGVAVENVAGSGDFRGAREAETTLQLSQLIPLGGKRAKAMREAGLARDLSAWDYQAVRLEVVSRAASDFVEVVADQQRSELAEELTHLAEQVVQAVNDRVKAAKSSPVELTRAKVALDLARIDRDRAQRTLTAARQRLSANWGSPKAAFETVVGNLRDLPDVPSLEELNRRLEHNPALARWATELEQRRAALNLEKSRAIPDLTLSAGYRRLSGSDDNALVAGVSIPLPFFDRNQGQIGAAKYRLAQAAAERRAAEVRLRTALGQAWQQYDAARATVDALQTRVLPGARQAYRTASEYYQQGRFSFLEVLDAQRTLFTARAQEIQALSECQQAANEIARLVGEAADANPNPNPSKTHRP